MTNSGQNFYQCVLIVEGVEVVVDGQRVDQWTVKCQSSRYVYSQEVGNKLVPLKLRWNRGFDIDNPDNVRVNLYKCDGGRSNCGFCHQANPKYHCGWCESGDEEHKCTIVSKCSQVTHWLTRDKICPDPTITQVKPVAGPIEGGTTLTIRGYSLGKNESNVKQVSVAGIPCVPISSGYKEAEQIQCVTSPSGSIVSGKVQITIGDSGDQVSYTGISIEDFSYVVSKIDGLTPQKGPQSGGTTVTISGENLYAGSVITATVAGYPCRITESSYDAITCLTSASDSSFASGGVTLTFDDVTKTNTDAIYRYMEDPVIQQLSRYKAFVSGGNKIEVTGRSLDIVHTRIMRVYIAGKHYDEGCTLNSPTSMVCRAPDVSASGIQPTAEWPYESDFGFIMDNVANTTHLRHDLAPFTYYPDPTYRKFEDGIESYNPADKERLIVAGENLDLASDEEDIVVKIGDSVCAMMSLDSDHLTCLPQEDLQHESLIGTELEVTILHGNIHVSIGMLRITASPPVHVYLGFLIGMVVLGVIISVAFAIAIAALVKSKKKAAKSQYQMVKLETRVQILQCELENVYDEAETGSGNSYETLDFCPGNDDSIGKTGVIDMEDHSGKNAAESVDDDNDASSTKALAQDGQEMCTNVACQNEYLRHRHDISSPGRLGYADTKNNGGGDVAESEVNGECINIERRDHLTSVQLNEYENTKSDDNTLDTFVSHDSLAGEACNVSLDGYKSMGIKRHEFENANHNTDIVNGTGSSEEYYTYMRSMTTFVGHKNDSQCDDTQSLEPHEYENTKCNDKADNNIESGCKEECVRNHTSYWYKGIGSEKDTTSSELHGVENTRNNSPENNNVNAFANAVNRRTMAIDDELKAARNEDEITPIALHEIENKKCTDNADIDVKSEEDEACMHNGSSCAPKNIGDGVIGVINITSSNLHGSENANSNDEGNALQNDPSKLM
ncbi:plexin-A4-like [Ptychodera flava]|uniref:plexin-A4-like n=1 Tax=Ptychodera flava TaxID=63121 RepID=UPI00396A8B30